MVRLGERFVDLFELPKEILLHLPLLVLFGDQSIYIENHRGIGLFGEEKIQIVVESGEVIIRGEALVIQEIHPQTLRIQGRIQGITFHFSGGDGGVE